MAFTTRFRALGRPLKRTIMKGLGSLCYVATDVPAAALTFDDGPHPLYTPRVLDILKRHEARATFFMVGESAQKYPGLVRRIGEAGHALGGHSWDHSSFPCLLSRQRRNQMLACQEVLSPYGQMLFRPPYGEQSLASRLDAFLLGYEVVAWNVDVGDWYETDSTVMASRLVQSIKPGCVVLLHDALFDEGKPRLGPRQERAACVDRFHMLKALDLALDHLDKHIRFVTVPELLNSGTPYREFWFKNSS